MRWDITYGSKRAMLVEVVTTNWVRPGGITSGADTQVMEKEASWVTDMLTITAAARVTGADTMAVEMKDRTETTAGTGIPAGVKGTHTTPSSPRQTSAKAKQPGPPQRR